MSTSSKGEQPIWGLNDVDGGGNNDAARDEENERREEREERDEDEDEGGSSAGFAVAHIVANSDWSLYR